MKTKMETVPFSPGFKDDRMTTWRSSQCRRPRSSGGGTLLLCSERVSPRTPDPKCFSMLNMFYLLHESGEETPTVEFVAAARARSAVRRLQRHPGRLAR